MLIQLFLTEHHASSWEGVAPIEEKKFRLKKKKFYKTELPELVVVVLRGKLILIASLTCVESSKSDFIAVCIAFYQWSLNKKSVDSTHLEINFFLISSIQKRIKLN